MDYVKPLAITNTANYSRASIGRYRDRNFVMQSAAVDAARFDYDPVTLACRLLVEAAATNAIRNNSGTGAAAGTPGTLPTNWTAALPSGLALAVVGAGTDSGVDYVDLRISGAAASAGTARINMEAAGQALAALADKWALSAYLVLRAGSLAGLAPVLGMDECAAGGAVLTSGTGAAVPAASAQIITGARAEFDRTLSAATVASVVPFFGVPVASGQVVDFTVRVGLPQLEKSARSTSPIRTTSAAATRAADVIPAGCRYISNLPEDDYPAWNGATAYALGARVASTVTHLVYESLRGKTAPVTITIASPGVISWPAHGNPANTRVRFSTTGALPTGIAAGTDYYVAAAGLLPDTFSVSATPGGAVLNTTGSQSGVHTGLEIANLGADPTLAGNSVSGTEAVPAATVKWLIVGKTNKWRAFDGRTTDQMQAANVLEFAIIPGSAISIAGFSHVTAASAKLSLGTAADGMVWHREINLTAANVRNWYDYFFAPFLRKTEFVVSGIPSYGTGILTVSLRGEGFTVGLGELTVGQLLSIGDTQWGASPGLDDYSIKTTDAYGNSYLEEGPYNRRLNADVFIPAVDTDESFRRLLGLRASVVLYIGSPELECAQLLGFIESFDVVLQSPAGSFATMDIKGV